MIDLHSTAATADRLAIALRAYAEPPPSKTKGKGRAPLPSEWALIFDTETTIDAGQALRFGTYQVRKGNALFETGLFYRPEVLASDEVALLTAYAEQHDLKLRTQAEFIDRVFYGIGYDLRATIVGFNLPFDLSRLAIRYGPARLDMRGGFTFTLSEDKRRPAVRIKHLSRRISFFRFAAPFKQRDARSDRRRGRKVSVRRGFFLDVNTLAHALLSRSFSLATLADHLGTEARKADTDEHGGPLTDAYVGYAVLDTQVTWECYVALTQKYDKLQLATPVHRIYSEASIGKAYLDAMGVKGWRETQPDVPPELIGTILSTYYGGRSEVRIRREMRQVVLCDFLSMYPTVCTLMGLWRFVIAKGMTWQDDTDATRQFLDRVTLEDLRQQDTWRYLTVLVQIACDGDIVPVRAAYDQSGATTIGLNHLTAEQSQWFTLADCVASKLLNGHAPKVVSAIRFSPGAPQGGLSAVAINGESAYKVAPRRQDLYKRLIELRHSVKGTRDRETGAEKERLDTLQNALKIAANATSYGIFAETNVTELSKRRDTLVHGGSGDAFATSSDKAEEPGRFFHPLVATLITGAARLMLALTERLVTNADLEWCFCDTDSMAIAKPAAMAEDTFFTRVDTVVAWFSALNPYEFDGTVLKIEEVNQNLDDVGSRTALYAYAVSAKRYVLFNLGADGMPIIRKASAHGLGHRRAPYDESNPAQGLPRSRVPLGKIGVALWQHDLWWKIAQTALNGPVVRLELAYHPALAGPVVSRYAATTPAIHRWFTRYNRDRSLDEQVKPFGFLLAFTVKIGHTGRPVAPFHTDHKVAVQHAFDRLTGDAVPVESLANHAQDLAQYHLHPEAKFENGNYLDSGTTRRRHVSVVGTMHIGKEANRWEEQFFLGMDPEADVEYGMSLTGSELTSELKQAATYMGQRVLAQALGISRGTLSSLLTENGSRQRSQLISRVLHTLPRVLREHYGERERRAQLVLLAQEAVRGRSLLDLAAQLDCDPSNLAKVLNERRAPSRTLCAALEQLAFPEVRR